MNNDYFDSYVGLNLKLKSKHPFLIDSKTVEFIKKSKILFITRGPPGAGKSTLATEIVKIIGKEKSELCEGDEFFTNSDGVYKYVREKINECHEYTLTNVRNACQKGKNCVIADDIHLTYSDIEPYIQTAREFNYISLLIEPRTSHKFDTDRLYENCKHNVSKQTIKRIFDEYQIIFPHYYAWFLNEFDSSKIVDMAKQCFDKVIQNFKSLNENFIKLKNSFDSDIFEYRNKFQLHCTSKFIGDKRSENLNYLFSLEVNESLGKVFELEICGFSISNRTLVADVRLKKDNILWDNDLNMEEKLEVLELNELKDCEEFFDKLRYADRAHLTIGLEPDLKAYKSGIDLIRVKLLIKIKNYKKIMNDDYDFFYFGDCYSYVKLKKTLKIPALFSAFY